MVSMDTLHRAARTLDAAGVEWWLIDGTCLSLVRSGLMESWQADVDIGVWDIPAATQALQDDEWPTVGAFPNQFKSHGKLDVLGHRREGDLVVSDYLENTTYRFSAHLFDRFDTVTVDGYPFKVPSPVGQYLTEHYGEDWRTPIQTWDWRYAPCAVRTHL